MARNGKKRFLKGLYVMERVHAVAARRMAEIEKDKDTRIILEKIAALEERHAELWKKIISSDDLHVSQYKIELSASRILFMRRVLGVALTVRTVERLEGVLYDKMISAAKRFRLSNVEKSVINRIRDDEKENMRPLEKKVIQYNHILNNIKDVVLGMNDGLVEVLAAVVGLAAALHASYVVLIGGLIVAVSGTLSMAAGAYLSTEYERSINVREDGMSRPKISALYMGVFYAMGAVVPLIPFIFGAGGVYAIASAIILTSVMLTIASTIIAIVSGTSITKRIAKTLLISIGVALVTILLGTFARHSLHLII